MTFVNRNDLTRKAPPFQPEMLSLTTCFGRLVNLVLEQHVVFGLQSEACAEDVLHASALFEEGIDDGRVLLDEWRLGQIREEAEDRVHWLELLLARCLNLNSLCQLCDDRLCVRSLGIIHFDSFNFTAP